MIERISFKGGIELDLLLRSPTDVAVSADPTSSAPSSSALEPPPPWEHDSTGLDLWPAGRLLGEHLAAHPALVEGRRVLEIGCGCGLVGLLAARLGAARVFLTDVDGDSVRLAATNAARNGLLQGPRREPGGCLPLSPPSPQSGESAPPAGAKAVVTASVLDFCRDPFVDADVVLASDICYVTRLAAPLVRFLAAAAAAAPGGAASATLLLAHERRHSVYWDAAAGAAVREGVDGPLEAFLSAAAGEGLRVETVASRGDVLVMALSAGRADSENAK